MEQISETRKILEQEFAKYKALEKSKEEEAASGPDAGQELPAVLAAEAEAEVDYTMLPKSFKKEMSDLFKALPSEMQKFLHEKDVEDAEKIAGLEKELESKKQIDEIYQKHALRLKSYGLENAAEWFCHLADLDEALEENPQAVICYLAQVYGVKPAEEPRRPHEMAGPDKQAEAARRMQEAWRCVSGLMQAVDEEGKAKFPYIDMVKAQMAGLLQCGASCDLEDAYHKAVWLHPQVRETLIKQRAEAALKEKAKEAEKAKQASFAPKGRLSQSDMSKLSTRELLTRLIND